MKILYEQGDLTVADTVDALNGKRIITITQDSRDWDKGAAVAFLSTLADRVIVDSALNALAPYDDHQVVALQIKECYNPEV